MSFRVLNSGYFLLASINWSDFQNHQKNIVEYCLKKEKPRTIESNVAIGAKSNLWESEFNFLDSDNPSIKALKDWLLYTSQTYINNLNRTNYKFVINESWAHVTRQHGYHSPHDHISSTWSGIFHIDGELGVKGTNTWMVPYIIERKKGLEFLGGDSASTPFEPGKLILFPSALTHWAEPYEGTKPRVVVAFNGYCE